MKMIMALLIFITITIVPETLRGERSLAVDTQPSSRNET